MPVTSIRSAKSSHKSSKDEEAIISAVFIPVNRAKVRRNYYRQRFKERLSSGPIQIPQDPRFDIDMHNLETPKELLILLRENFSLSVEPENLKSIVNTLQCCVFPDFSRADRFNNCYAFTTSQISQFLTVFQHAFHTKADDPHDKILIRCAKRTFSKYCSGAFFLDLDFDNQMVYLKNKLISEHAHTLEFVLEICGIVGLKSDDNSSYQYQKIDVKNPRSQGLKKGHRLKSDRKRDEALPVEIKEDPDFHFDIKDSMTFGEFWKKVDTFRYQKVYETPIKDFVKVLKYIEFQVELYDPEVLYKFTVSQFCQFVSCFRDAWHATINQYVDSHFSLSCSKSKLNNCGKSLNISFDREKQLVYVRSASAMSHNHDLEDFLKVASIL